jgi:MFS family permease
MMAGNVSTASAAVADSFEGRDRAKGMGVLGAGIGLGFVVGPAIGGLAAGSFDLTAHFPELARIGLNPFSAAALVSFAMATLNLVWAARKFPETLPKARRGGGPSSDGKRTFHPFRALRSIDLPGVRRANLAYFLYLVVFSAMEFSLTFLAHERFGFGVGDQAMMFVFIGLVIAVVQGGLVRRLVPVAGERLLTRVGMALTVPGFVLVGVAQNVTTLYVGNAFLAVGAALVMPCVAALVSRYTPVERQGISQGILRSMGSLARAAGPIGGGLLYWLLGSWAPYLLGAGVLLAPLWLSLKLPAPPPSAPLSAPPEGSPSGKSS